MAERKQTTPAEVTALERVYGKLGELLTALREARANVHHPELLAAINAEIDRQLEADAALRRAMVNATGHPVQDPY